MRQLSFISLLILISVTLVAQKKQYSSLREAIYASTVLRGDQGPSEVQWIEEGDRFSFSKREGWRQQIWTYDIKHQTEKLIFSESEFTFPGTDDPAHGYPRWLHLPRAPARRKQ